MAELKTLEQERADEMLTVTPMEAAAEDFDFADDDLLLTFGAPSRSLRSARGEPPQRMSTAGTASAACASVCAAAFRAHGAGRNHGAGRHGPPRTGCPRASSAAQGCRTSGPRGSLRFTVQIPSVTPDAHCRQVPSPSVPSQPWCAPAPSAGPAPEGGEPEQWTRAEPVQKRCPPQMEHVAPFRGMVVQDYAGTGGATVTFRRWKCAMYYDVCGRVDASRHSLGNAYQEPDSSEPRAIRNNARCADQCATEDADGSRGPTVRTGQGQRPSLAISSCQSPVSRRLSEGLDDLQHAVTGARAVQHVVECRTRLRKSRQLKMSLMPMSGRWRRGPVIKAIMAFDHQQAEDGHHRCLSCTTGGRAKWATCSRFTSIADNARRAPMSRFSSGNGDGSPAAP